MVEIIHELIVRVGRELIKNWIRYRTNRSFYQRHKKVFQIHPEYRHPINRDIEENHIKLWKVLRKDIKLDTLRLYSNISGRSNPEIVPEEVFASDVQRSLCKKQEKVECLANKSFYNRWYPGDLFPKSFVHNIEGSFFNSKYEPLNKEELDKLLECLEYPVVIKPNMDSMGGANVYFPKDKKELKSLMKGTENYVIQKVIRQNEYFAKYNRYGLNTIRVNLYRSVKTNDVYYLHACLRMGRGGGLDNVTAGGILCFIHKNGRLDNYAVDGDGNKYKKHPDTKIEFSKDVFIPYFEEMKKIAIKVAREIYLARLISIDMCIDENDKWRVIEINLADTAIRTAQYAGQPFFGPFTREVIDYCKNNPWWKT